MGSTAPETPEPGMESTIEVAARTTTTHVVRKRKLRVKRRRRRMRPTVLYALAAGLVALVGLAVQLVIHTYRTEPRDAHMIAERELRVNTLGANERIIRTVSVFQRPWLDYFRATRGLLVLTNRRLLFLGLQPRELLAAGDSPPTFEQRDFSVDTLVRVHQGRTFFGIARAVVVDTPDGRFEYGVPPETWGKASLLLHSIEARHDRQHAEGVRQKVHRDAFEVRRRLVAAEAEKPRYYTVKRGDALVTVAARWNTSPDTLMRWNRLTGNKIKVGQQLLVKPSVTQPRATAVAGEVRLPKK